jgi:hypothetical protein
MVGHDDESAAAGKVLKAGDVQIQRQHAADIIHGRRTGERGDLVRHPDRLLVAEDLVEKGFDQRPVTA